MKSRILNLCAALALFCGSATAQTLSVQPINVEAEAATEIAVSLAGATSMTALQFNLALPTGLTYQQNSGNYGITLGAAAAGHTLSVSELASGELLVVLYNMNLNTFTDGQLLTIPVVASEEIGTTNGALTKVRTALTTAVSTECADVNFSATIKGVELTLTEGQNFSQTEATKVDQLTYTRTLPNLKWNALYLPVEIPVSALSDKYDVAYFNNMHAYDSDNDGTIERMDMEVIRIAQGTLHANHPYFIRAKNDAAKKMNLVLTDVTVESTDAANCTSITTSSAYMNFELKGIYTRHEASDLQGCYAITGSGSWAPIAANSWLNPFRFYLKMTKRDGTPVKTNEAVQTIRIFLQGEEEVTGVEGTTVNGQEPTEIYDLQGRRVTHPAKGMYIVNGKKVMVK